MANDNKCRLLPFVHPRSWRYYLLRVLPCSIDIGPETTLQRANKAHTVSIEASQDEIASAGTVDPLWYPEDRVSLKRPRYVQKRNICANNNNNNRKDCYDVSANAADNDDNSGGLRVTRKWSSNNNKRRKEKKKIAHLWTPWNNNNNSTSEANNKDKDCDDNNNDERIEVTLGVRRGSGNAHAEYSGEVQGDSFGRARLQVTANGRSSLALRTRPLFGGLELDLSGKTTLIDGDGSASKRRYPISLSLSEVGMRCAKTERSLRVGSGYVEVRPLKNSAFELRLAPADMAYRVRLNHHLTGGIDGALHKAHLSLRRKEYRLSVRHNEVEYEANNNKWEATLRKNDMTLRFRCPNHHGSNAKVTLQLSASRASIEYTLEQRDNNNKYSTNALQRRLLARLDTQRGLSLRLGRFY